MRILANSEDPDERPHNAASLQGLHCLLRQKQTSEREKFNFIVKLQPVTPQYIQWTISSLLFQARRRNLLVHKGLIEN